MSLELVDAMVEKNVKLYKDDWYKFDRPRAEKDSTFIISLRDTGVDCLFLGNMKSYVNMIWSKSCFESERAKSIYLYDNGKMKRITHEKAKKSLEDAIETCPKGYWDECSELTLKDPCPTVNEYREYMKYKTEQVNHFLAYSSLAEWMEQKIIPY